MSSEDINKGRWALYLTGFTRRNHDRPIRIEVLEPEVGLREVQKHLTLIGVSLEDLPPKKPDLKIRLGGRRKQDKWHFDYSIGKLQRIMPIVGQSDLEDGIGIVSVDGTLTLLMFEDIHRPSSL